VLAMVEKEVKEQLKEILQSKKLSSLTFDGSLYSKGKGYTIEYKEATKGKKDWTINEIGLFLLENLDFDLNEDVKIDMFIVKDKVELGLNKYGRFKCMHFEIIKFKKDRSLYIYLCKRFYGVRRFRFDFEIETSKEIDGSLLKYDAYDTFEEAIQGLKSYILNGLDLEGRL
jgi:hypothetical protein